VSGLVTVTWLQDGEQVHSETVPHAHSRLHLIEKSVALSGGPDETELTVRVEFDPPVVCPEASA
jgi:hypothetical protein